MSMIVKAEGPSGRAKIHSDDPKHALGLVQYLRTIGYNAWVEDTNGNEIDEKALKVATRSSHENAPLAASHQAAGDVGGSAAPRVRSVGRKIAGNRDENVPALVGVAPLGELPDARLQHLIGMEACIFAEQRTRERGDQRLRRMTELEMPRD